MRQFPSAELDLFITLDATSLEARDYEADLHIHSNDPDNSEVVINVLLHAEPASAENIEIQPIEFNLSSAYPNPFNSTTRIDYSIPVFANVNIKIYDIAGHLVKTLVHENKASGIHSVFWDSANQANGVYLIRLEAEDYQVTRKVTLLK